MPRLVLAVLLGTTLALVVGCASRAPRPTEAPPSILLVTLDTVRADHTSAYGYARATTPRLKQLADQGVLCEAAYAPMPTTGPSHATMFTSLLPRAHGVVKNGVALPEEHRTLAEILRQRGYRTAAFVSAYPLYRDFGFDQGFTEYDDDFIPPTAPAAAAHQHADRLQAAYERGADGTTAQAARWLEQHGYLSARGAGASGPAPFFLWLHLFDPHAPYQPPPEHAALFAPRDPSASDLERSVAAYDGEIHFADAEMGGLLDKLSRSDRLDETLVVVAGDHGEGLMQHGHMGHGLTLYEEQVRVPLIFRWPKGLPAGRSVEAPVQLLDLAPTILDLAGGAGERPLEGRSLKGALTGVEVPDPERRVFLQRRDYESRVVQGVPVSGAEHAVRIGRWKYIEAADQGTYELYDLAADPQERHNRFRDRPDTARALASILGDWKRGPGERVLQQALSPEQVERLRALGYVQ